jgi:hypothetical protein
LADLKVRFTSYVGPSFWSRMFCLTSKSRIGRSCSLSRCVATLRCSRLKEAVVSLNCTRMAAWKAETWRTRLGEVYIIRISHRDWLYIQISLRPLSNHITLIRCCLVIDLGDIILDLRVPVHVEEPESFFELIDFVRRSEVAYWCR